MALLVFGRQWTWSSFGDHWLLFTINWILLGRGKRKLLTGEIGLHLTCFCRFFFMCSSSKLYVQIRYLVVAVMFLSHFWFCVTILSPVTCRIALLCCKQIWIWLVGNIGSLIHQSLHWQPLGVVRSKISPTSMAAKPSRVQWNAVIGQCFAMHAFLFLYLFMISFGKILTR